MRWEKQYLCSLSVQPIVWGQRGEQGREAAPAPLEMLVGVLCPASDGSHQTGAPGVQGHIVCQPGILLLSAPRTALAISLNILPCTSRILKYLLDVGLGCCHNTSNQIRELMWTGMARHRSLWSYSSSSLAWERVKKLPETLLLLRQEN